jgi:hypothetical protein
MGCAKKTKSSQNIANVLLNPTYFTEDGWQSQVLHKTTGPRKSADPLTVQRRLAHHFKVLNIFSFVLSLTIPYAQGIIKDCE